MTCTATDLRALQRCLEALVGENGFSLAKGDLPSPEIDALFDAVLNGGPLVVTSPKVSLQQRIGAVEVSGGGGSFPFSETTVSALFSLPGGVPQLSLTATGSTGGADPWTLAAAFPSLKESLVEDLSFTNPELRLNSVDGGSGLPEGLSFAGSLQLTGNLGLLNVFFPTPNVALFGSATVSEGTLPTFSLLSQDHGTLVFPGFSLQADVTLAAAPDGKGGVTASFTVAASLPIETRSGPKKLTIATTYPFELNQIVFVANVGTAFEMGLAELARVTAGENLLAVLPTQLPIVSNLAFQDWSVAIDPVAKSFRWLSTGVRSREPWLLLPDGSLTLDPLDFTFVVTRDQGRFALAAQLSADFVFEQAPKPPATLRLSASFPGFLLTGFLISGSLDLRRLVERYLGGGAAGLLPETLELTALQLTVDPASRNFSFAATVESDWQIPIGIVTFDLKQISAAIARSASANSGKVAALVGIGPLEAQEKPTIALSAAWDEKGWRFAGGLADGSKVRWKEDIVDVYLPEMLRGIGALDLTLTKLNLFFEKGTQDSTYGFQIAAVWKFNLGNSPETEFVVEGEADITSSPAPPPGGLPARPLLPPPADDDLGPLPVTAVADRVYTGFVKGTVKFFGVDFSVTVVLKPGTPDFIVKFGPVEGKVIEEPVSKDRILEVKLTKSLGELVSLLVAAATESEPVSLPSPWNLLDNIRLQDFTFKFNFTKKKIGFTYTPSPSLDFGFAALQELSLWYDTTTKRVDFSIDKGRFLDKRIPQDKQVSWDVKDPGAAPAVPGQGEKLFDLRFLALGQHVFPKNGLAKASILAAVNDMEAAFKKPAKGGSPITGTGLRFDAGTNWLIATDAVVLSTVAIRAAFIDPELYGVNVGVNGPRGGKLNGLGFEILYKRVNETVGVYQLELKLPDALRSFDIGQVTVTLPVIRISIYTNGDFKVDFGFPENEDFSRAFGVQVLPFVGAGGFYFGVMSGATSAVVPKATCGDFTPVIEFGIGLRVGIGKEIKKGILEAGLSVSVMGIVEGAIAFFNRYGEVSKDFFFRIQGKVAIVGRLFGAIDFAIISARLDITIKIGATLAFQIYEPATVGVFAEVSVSLEVSINLGIFKISITLSFRARIEASFTIGSKQPAPWDCGLPPDPTVDRTGRYRLRGATVALDDCPDPCAAAEPPKWQPILVDDADRWKVELLAAPQLTAASDLDANGVLQPAKPRIVAMLYARASANPAEGLRGGKTPRTASLQPVAPPFETVAEAALLWALNAYLNRKKEKTTLADVLGATATAEDLDVLFCALSDPFQDPFTKDELDAFVSTFFKLEVAAAKPDDAGTEPDATVSAFPVVPILTLVPPTGAPVSFDEKTPVDADYRKRIKDTFRELMVRYESAEERDARAAALARRLAGAPTLSLARYLWIDFFALLARETVQAAIDTLKSATAEVSGEESLAELVAARAHWGLSARDVAEANATRRLRAGARLAVPAGARLRAGAHVVGDGKGETLLGVARRYGTTVAAVAEANAEARGLFPKGRRLLFPGAESMTVQELVDALRGAGRFESLSGLAARIFLQGVRLAAPDPAKPQVALFELTGQQLDATGLAAGAEVKLTLPGVLPWIGFKDGGLDGLTLSMTLTPREAEVIAAFTGITLGPLPDALALAPFFETEPRRFTLANAIVWNAPSPVGLRGVVGAPGARPSGAANAVADLSIWQFPDDLAFLLTSDPPVEPKVTIEEEIRSAAHQAAESLHGLVPEEGFVWASRFDVTLRRVPSTVSPGTPLPTTYDLLGADTAGTAVLESLLSYWERQGRPDIVDAIHVLYTPDPAAPAPPVGLKSDASVSLFLLQTNLSTFSSPALLARAAATPPPGVRLVGQTPIDFLRLVWEASVVRSGGFDFHYETADGSGLPDHLFGENTDATVSLVVTYKIDDDVLRSFLNALVVAKPVDVDDTVFYLQAVPESNESPLLSRLPTAPQGNVGFTGTRTPPAAPRKLANEALGADDPQAALQELYNLLGFRVGKTADFDESPIGVPVGPAESAVPSPDPEADLRPRRPEANDVWKYQAVVPVFPFTKKSASPLDDDVPPPEDDPYRGIGKGAAIELAYHDLFGNRIVTADTPPPASRYRLPVTLEYTDTLLAVSTWPNLGTEWKVEKTADGNVLTLDLALDVTPYTPPDVPPVDPCAPTYRDRARADMATYALAWYQLAQPGVSATLASTLGPLTPLAGQPTPLALLQGFVLPVWRMLRDIAEGKPITPVPIRASIALSVSDANPNEIYSLELSLAISRPEALVTDAADLPGLAAVQEVATLLSPVFAKPPGSENDVDAPLTLTAFAQKLEAAFPTLKVATSPPARSRPGAAATPGLFIVRFAKTNGFTFAIDSTAPFFYAIRPLGRTPLSKENLEIPTYDPAKPIYETPTRRESFSNVDVETMGRSLLGAVDQLLSPDFGPLAWQVQAEKAPAASGPPDPKTRPVDSILDSKKRLAGAVAEGLGLVLKGGAEPDPQALLDARERLRQQLLVRLSDAAIVDAVVQFPVAVTSSRPDPKTAPRLFGKPVIEKPVPPSAAAAAPDVVPNVVTDPPRDAWLSTSKVALSNAPGSSFLTFLFGSRDEAGSEALRRGHATLMLSYAISHLEHDIRSVPGIADYQASSWLTFVLPLADAAGAPLARPLSEANDLGTVTIPLPLRAYPTPPSLVAQVGEGEPIDPQGDLLRQAQAWRASFDYERPGVGSDTLHAVVTFNVEGGVRPFALAAPKDLLEALLQFTSVSGPLVKDLTGALLTGDADKAWTGLRSFAWLVKAAADTWGAWVGGGNARAFSAVGTVEAKAKIVESATKVPDFDGEFLLATVDREDASAFELLEIRIDGYETRVFSGDRKGSTVSYLFWKDEAPLTYEAGIGIPRRRAGLGGLNVLEMQNAWAGGRIFRNERLVPGKETRDDFIYQTPLVRFVDPFTPALAPDVAIDVSRYTTTPPPSDKLFVYLTNFLAAYFDQRDLGERVLRFDVRFRYEIAPGLPVAIPLLLTTPYGVTTPTDQPFTRSLADALMTRLAEGDLIHRDGTLVLDLALYSSLAKQDLPTLRLGGLFLDVSKIRP